MPLKISPSQLATKRSCTRQWVFSHLLRLPRIKKGYFAFGNVLHAVVERWLKADKNGRDRVSGKAVDLYPDGWATDVERDGTSTTVTQEEQDLIQSLVNVAIEDGSIVRIPGRKMEEYFSREVCEGVLLHGYIDVLYDNMVEDHKTTKAKKWALSPKKLHQDIKMRCYAIEAAIRTFEETGKQPETVTMYLNYFVKDPFQPRTFRRSASVTAEELDGEWERIVDDAEGMKLWAEKYESFLDKKKKRDYTTIDLEEIPPPEKHHVCNEYGGCPFQTICTGRESVHRYVSRVDAILHPPVKDHKETTMAQTMFQKRLEEIKASKGQATSAPEAPVQEPPASPPIQAPPAAPEVKVEPAPWANAEHEDCAGTGLDQHGEACPVCFKLAKKAGLPLPAQCKLNPKTGKWSSYTETEGQKLEELPVMPSTVDTTQPEKVKAKGLKAALEARKKAAPTPEQVQKVETPTPSSNEVESPAPMSKKEKKAASGRTGRPPQGFTLCLGVAPLRTGKKEILYADQIFEQLKAIVLEETGKAFEEHDPFLRRDMLVTSINTIKNALGSAVIITTRSPTPDMRSLIEGLKPYADMIYAPMEY